LRVYIATVKSKQVIKDAKKIEKDGGIVDWQKVLQESHELRAKGSDEQVKAVGETKK